MGGSIESFKGAVANMMLEIEQQSNLWSESESFRFRVFLPEYRLAPEHVLPAGIRDCTAAYQFLLKEHGILPQDIILMGDSAGGHLTVSVALAAKQNGLPSPSSLVLLSPWTDLYLTGESLKTNHDQDGVLRLTLLQDSVGWAAPTDLLKQTYSLLQQPSGIPLLLSLDSLSDKSLQRSSKAFHQQTSKWEPQRFS